MTPRTRDLQYPIGRFTPSGSATRDQIRVWIDDIAELPSDLRRAVEPLTDSQLDTPYRPGGWTVRQVVHPVAMNRKKDLLKTAGGKYVAPQPIENRLRACPYLLNAVLVGDRRPYVVALLVPDFDKLAEFARQRGLPCSPPAELARHEQVRALLQQQVDAVNAELAPFEQVKRFVVLERDFSMESGELTPTMKVRRRVVEQKYRDAVDSLYEKT